MEQWETINTIYAPNYEISNLGKLRNKKTKRLLKFATTKGYKSVLLVDKKTFKRKRVRIHRLVAASFNKDFDPLLQVDHINNVRDDNRSVNLRSVNYSINNRRRGISLRQIERIIDLHKQGKKASEILVLV